MRMPRCLLLAVALTAGPAHAQDEGELIGLINAYRTVPQTCEGKRMPPAGVLTPSSALARAQIASGAGLTDASKAVGYNASRVQMIRIAEPSRPASVMNLLQPRYCRSFLNPRYSEIGISREGATWRIVLAQPLLADDLGDWREAGKAILALVNAARAEPRSCGEQRFGAAAAVAWDDELAAASLAHSRDMAQRNYFGHAGKSGGTAADRAKHEGYRWRGIGENIAAGQGSPEKVVAGWIASPGHCANIMNPAFIEMGAAYAMNPDSAMVIYWTQVFGTPR